MDNEAELWQTIVRRKIAESGNPEMQKVIEEADDIVTHMKEQSDGFLARVEAGVVAKANENVGLVVKWIFGLVAGIGLAITWVFTDGAMSIARKVMASVVGP